MNYPSPFSPDTEFQVARPTGEYAHENFQESKYAIDLVVPVKTPIHAIADGQVITVKADSDEYGLDKELAEKANLVALKHINGEYSEYIHLGKDQIVVNEGQAVKAGDLLGYTGLSGCMSTPHLHLNVFKIENGEGISIPFELVT